MNRRLFLPAETDIPIYGWQPYSDVHRERLRAHRKHDPAGNSMERKEFDDPAWLPVLVEEVGEVARAMCEYRHLNLTRDEFTAALREELVQVAAMTVAWISAIDLTPKEDPAAGADRPCRQHLGGGVSTIHQELSLIPGPTSWFSTLKALGIDPDLPAEWATVDRCLTWLRERGHTVQTHAYPKGEVRALAEFGVNGRVVTAQGAPTLHAALIAACKAVQEATP